MTLARKMIAGTAALILGLMLLAAAALWGIAGINRNLGQALTAYETVRRTYEVGLDVAQAREMLQTNPPDPLGAANRVRAAMFKLDAVPPVVGERDITHSREALRAGLTEIIKIPESSTPESAPIAAAVAHLNSVLNSLAAVAQQTRQQTVAIDQERTQRVRAAMATLGAISVILVLAAILVGIAQYRGVMRPLHRLAEGVKQIAAGHFAQRLPTNGGDELARLSEDFNRMAVELDTLYRHLEEKVDAKSRELIQSERLASVGFLAAGVAHEINNPLGIIAGHAELSLRAIERGDGSALDDSKKTLRIIADEAFRCKQITEKLLSLVRGGGGRGRESVDVAAAVREVIALTAALPRYRGREVIFAGTESMAVTANGVELKQVLLNLVVNALEAIESTGPSGRVEIAARRSEPMIEITVSDNGCGMTEETLCRVFEPFFTQKRGVDEGGATAGVGLGLSITHAIVEAHGGRIRAESGGPRRGSRFIMEWPTA